MDMYEINLAGLKSIRLGDIRGVYLLLRQYGVRPNDIDLCLDQLISKDHNVAHIGINKTFIFSERKEVA